MHFYIAKFIHIIAVLLEKKVYHIIKNLIFTESILSNFLLLYKNNKQKVTYQSVSSDLKVPDFKKRFHSYMC